jgi:hypothetical protein
MRFSTLFLWRKSRQPVSGELPLQKFSQNVVGERFEVPGLYTNEGLQYMTTRMRFFNAVPCVAIWKRKLQPMSGRLPISNFVKTILSEGSC